MYGLVETYNASNVSKLPLQDKINTVVEMPSTPWIVHGVQVGSYVTIGVIKEIAGLKGVDITRMHGRKVRQYDPNQRDRLGRDISGKFVMNDVAAAFLFENQKHAAQWVRNPRQVHIGVAPSLLWVESGHANVGFFSKNILLDYYLYLYYALEKGMISQRFVFTLL